MRVAVEYRAIVSGCCRSMRRLHWLPLLRSRNFPVAAYRVEFRRSVPDPNKANPDRVRIFLRVAAKR